MPRVHHVKKARRAVKSAGIKVGDSYYWWANRSPGSRSGVKHFSKTPPRPSQVTGSPYFQEAYSIEETLEDSIGLDVITTAEDLHNLASAFTDAAEAARTLGSDCEDKLNNMPEGLQQGSTGELLQQRVDACEALADNLETVASELESWEPDEGLQDDDIGIEAQRFLEEAHSNISFDWE